MFLISTFGISLYFIFVLFQLHRNRRVKGGYQIISWDESQTQVIYALSTIIFLPSKIQRSFVPNSSVVIIELKRNFFYYCLVAMVTIETVGFKPR